MDDGSIQNKGLHLNTYSFSKEEVILLKNAIEKIFVPIELLASPKQEQEKFILMWYLEPFHCHVSMTYINYFILRVIK